MTPMRKDQTLSGPDEIIMFTRFPVAGKAKTRLIPELGAKGAAQLQRRLTENAIRVLRDTARDRCVKPTVCFTGGRRREFRSWLGSDLNYRAQGRGDLGARMRQSFEAAFAQGARKVLAVGTDVPGVSSNILRQAITALEGHDIVLGPAEDGGYYLIGMKRFKPELFAGIDWGTGRVAKQTRAVIQSLGLSVMELPMLNDIDRPGDLQYIRNNPEFGDLFTGNPLLSVIIPTLNEAAVLAATLDRAMQGNGIEIIVVDGGSDDTTQEIAAGKRVKFAKVQGGRAAQLNVGARLANGRHLLFLHADTLLPEGYALAVRDLLNNPTVAAGAFKFRTDGSGIRMRFLEWATNVRSSLFGWPYGDQGIFLEKRIFAELGGFRDLPIMEDFDLVRRLRRRGRVIVGPDSIVTSVRRWQSLGIMRTMLRNQLMIMGYYAGVAPERLASFYRAKGRK